MSSYCTCCSCAYYGHGQNFPIDAPCPPLSVSYKQFHGHARERGLGEAVIQDIAKQCNLTIEIIIPKPSKEEHFWIWWKILVIILGIVVFILMICMGVVVLKRRQKRRAKQAEADLIGSSCSSSIALDNSAYEGNKSTITESHKL